jgi:hypothetical protein
VSVVELTEVEEVYRGSFSWSDNAGGVRFDTGPALILTDEGLFTLGLRMVSTSPPGLEGCRTASGTATDPPIPLELLAVTQGWYGCYDLGAFRVGQLHLAVVDPTSGRLDFEIVIWDRP